MIQAICWTLVHSLWQGLLFAMAAGIVMLFTRRASAAVRYNLLCGLFFAFLVMVAGTFIYEWRMVGYSTVGEGGSFIEGSRGWLGGWIETLGGYCSAHAVPIVWGWLFIFMFKSLRMMGSLLYTQRIRNYGISAPPGDWQQRCDMLTRQLGIGRAVRLVESRIVKVPLVAGVFRPMIFMPIGLLTGLPEGEIEAVLLHELAHIRRNDCLVNFLQHLAGNILFFNPGFLWMSALLKDERENCCDDIAIDNTRDRIQFVRALISFKEHDLRGPRLANTFPAGKQQLLKRVSRIAYNTNKTLDPAEKVFLLVSSLLIILLVAATSDHSRVAAQVFRAPKGNNRIIQDRPRMAGEGTKVFEESRALAELRTPAEEGPIKVEEKAAMTPPVKTGVSETQGNDGRGRDEWNGQQAEHGQDEVSRQAAAAEQDMENKQQAERDREQAERDRQQAGRDREQADRDRQQAELDQQQAIRAKKQAEMDAQQAERDRQQAERDRLQGDRDRLQADKDRAQAERDRQQAERDRQQAERDREQALKATRQSH